MWLQILLFLNNRSIVFFCRKGGEGAGGWFVDIIVVWSLILKLILIKSNIFSFGGSVTLKQAILLPNICTFRMESNLKHL